MHRPDPRAKDTFTWWLRTYTLIPMGVGILMQFLVAVLACSGATRDLTSKGSNMAESCNFPGSFSACAPGSSSVFKLGLRLQFMTSFVTIGLVIWGWIEFLGLIMILSGGLWYLSGAGSRIWGIYYWCFGKWGTPIAGWFIMDKNH